MPVPPAAAQGAHRCLAGDALCPDTVVGFYLQHWVQELTEVELEELAPHEFLPCVCQWLSAKAYFFLDCIKTQNPPKD